MHPKPGDVINGKYRLLRLIGDGGMGSVFEARHEFLGTAVALKFLHPELARRPGLVARFMQEARLAASIRSPHIAHVTDVDQAGEGAGYLVMELLRGESLQSLLDRERRVSRDTALDYTLQILSGLDAAHSMGAVHRDLKPDNVFVTPSPHGPFLKILDFGIAKLRTSREFQAGLTRPGVMMGTPEYMAPEQAFSADTVDARADIYAVGVMLFEMIAGRRPLDGDDARDIATRVLASQVIHLRQLDPSIPEPLAQIVHRAMAPAPAHRIGSAAELRDALTPWCGALSLAGKLASTPSPPPVQASPAVVPPGPAEVAGTKRPPPHEPGAHVMSMAASVMRPTTPKVSTGTHPDDPGVAPPAGVSPGAVVQREQPPGVVDSRATTAPMSQVTPPQSPPPRAVAQPAYALGPHHTQQAPGFVPANPGTAAMPIPVKSGTAAMAIPAKSGTAAMPIPVKSGTAAMPIPVKSGTAAMPIQTPYPPAAYAPTPQASSEQLSYLQSAPGVVQATRPTRSRGPRGLSAGVFLALTGAAGVIAVVAVMAVRSPSGGSGQMADWPDPSSPGLPPTAPSLPSAPAHVSNITNPPGTTTPTNVIAPPLQPTAQPPTQPTYHPTSTSKPPAKPPDAGSGREAGVVFPPFAIPFPSALPTSLPSSLPPLPTTLPTTLPTILPFPIPGLPGIQPAPSASR